MESFVDLAYRGLTLGRRIKLTQMRPSTGYLEHPTPMPVGTAVSIKTDDGVVFDAVVVYVYEQIGGSERAPGMTVKPTFGDAGLASWWSHRVTLPELDPTRHERSRSTSVRPRSRTVPPEPAIVAPVDLTVRPTSPGAPSESPSTTEITQPIAYTHVAPQPQLASAPIDSRNSIVASGEITPKSRGEKKTSVMNAVDQELLERLTREPDDIERLVSTSEHEVVDDGQRTMVMEAIDPAALGLDVTASGSFPATAQDDDEDGGDDEPDKSEATTAGGDKKSKGSVKRRKKRR